MSPRPSSSSNAARPTNTAPTIGTIHETHGNHGTRKNYQPHSGNHENEDDDWLDSLLRDCDDDENLGGGGVEGRLIFTSVVFNKEECLTFPHFMQLGIPDEEASAFIVEQTLRDGQEREARSSQGREGRKVHKIISSGNLLPSHSGGLERAIRSFVLFMMGCPKTLEYYPPSPTEGELKGWNTWKMYLLGAIKKKIASTKEEEKKISKAEDDLQLKDVLKKIFQKLPPPSFMPQQDHSSKE